MKPKLYLITSIPFLLLSLVLSPFWFHALTNFKQTFDVGGWLVAWGLCAILILGIFYVLIGMRALKINRLSKISLKLSIVALAISGIGIPLIFVIVTFILVPVIHIDTLWGLSSLLLLFVSASFMILSLLLCVISILKKDN